MTFDLRSAEVLNSWMLLGSAICSREAEIELKCKHWVAVGTVACHMDPYGSIWNILNRRQIECKLNATCSNLIATTFWSFRHSWTTLRMLSTRNPSECSECDAWCDVQPICVYFLQALVIFVLEQLVCNWQKGGSPSGLGKTQRLHKRTYKIL